MADVFERFYVPAVKLETSQVLTGAGDGPQSLSPIVLENLDGQGIVFDWAIERDNTNQPDQGEITIFNLAPRLIGELHNAWRQAEDSRKIGGDVRLGYSARFSLGWDGIVQTLMIGDVWDFIPAIETPTDTMTVFKLGDGNRALRDRFMSRVMTRISIERAIDYLVHIVPNALDVGGGGLGLIYPKASKDLIQRAAQELPDQNYTNIPPGNTKQLLDDLMETLGLEWRVHNGEFVAMRDGQINESITLKPSTGLLRAEPRGDGGIDVLNYADPRIQPGTQLKVLEEDNSPIAERAYRVDKMLYRGRTRGGSTSSIIASKAVLS